MIQVICPTCGKDAKTAEENLGKKAVCSRCKNRFLIQVVVAIPAAPKPPLLQQPNSLQPPPLPEFMHSGTNPTASNNVNDKPSSPEITLSNIPAASSCQNEQNQATDVDFSRAPAITALIAAVLLAISIPMKWLIVLDAGFAQISTSGWIILLEVIGLGLCALAQLGTKTRKEALDLAKPIAVLAAFPLLFAIYTVLTYWSVSADVDGYSSGFKTGPSVWLAIIAGLVGVCSQANYIIELEEKSPDSNSDIIN